MAGSTSGTSGTTPLTAAQKKALQSYVGTPRPTPISNPSPQQSAMNAYVGSSIGRGMGSRSGLSAPPTLSSSVAPFQMGGRTGLSDVGGGDWNTGEGNWTPTPTIAQLPSQTAPTLAPPNFGMPQANPNDPMLKMITAMMTKAGNAPAYNPPNIATPTLPRTDISGLYNQYAPQVNQTFDKLINQLQSGQTQQKQDFQGIYDRMVASYAQPAADVASRTAGANANLQGMVERFGLQPAMQGEAVAQRDESAARLANLASQSQAAQTTSLDTLRNARNQMYDTYLSGAQASRAAGLQQLMSEIATGQSNIDVARMQGLTALGQTATQGNVDLAKLAAGLKGETFGNQMNLLGMLQQVRDNSFNQDLASKKFGLDQWQAYQSALNSAGSGGGASGDWSSTEEMSQTNPGILQDLSTIPDPAVQHLVSDAWYATGDPNEAIKQLAALKSPKPEDPLNPTRGMGYRPASIDAAIEYLRPYASDFGGQSRKVTNQRKKTG